MNSKDKDEYYGAFYPHLRGFCLRDKEVWGHFENLMRAYEEAKIPHPYTASTVKLVNKVFCEKK